MAYAYSIKFSGLGALFLEAAVPDE